ncbi:hypothetical protein Gotur_013276 [Gossypium turneri]
MASRSCLYVVLLLLAFQSTVIKATVPVLPPQCRPVAAGSLARIEFLANLVIGVAEFYLRSSNGTGIEDIAPGLVQGPVPIGATVATRSLLQYYLAQIIPSIVGTNQQQLVAGIGLNAAAQAGYFRTRLNAIVNTTVPPYTITVANFTNTTATAVNLLGLCGVKNEGLIVPPALGAENRTTTNVIPGDVNSLSPRRTEREMLRILYGTRNATRPGGIFPSGLTGRLPRTIFVLRLF